jgi:hypothetical protein
MNSIAFEVDRRQAFKNEPGHASLKQVSFQLLAVSFRLLSFVISGLAVSEAKFWVSCAHHCQLANRMSAYHRTTVLFYYYGRARASARSDHYVFGLFFRIPFFILFFFIFIFLFSLSRNL